VPGGAEQCLCYAKPPCTAQAARLVNFVTSHTGLVPPPAGKDVADGPSVKAGGLEETGHEGGRLSIDDVEEGEDEGRVVRSFEIHGDKVGGQRDEISVSWTFAGCYYSRSLSLSCDCAAVPWLGRLQAVGKPVLASCLCTSVRSCLGPCFPTLIACTPIFA